MEYDIRDFQYIKGKSNVIADALSPSVDSVESVHELPRAQASRAKVRDQSVRTVIGPRGHVGDPGGQGMNTVIDPRGHVMSTAIDPGGHVGDPRGQGMNAVIGPGGHVMSTVIDPRGHVGDPRGQGMNTE